MGPIPAMQKGIGIPEVIMCAGESLPTGFPGTSWASIGLDLKQVHFKSQGRRVRAAFFATCHPQRERERGVRCSHTPRALSGCQQPTERQSGARPVFEYRGRVQRGRRLVLPKKPQGLLSRTQWRSRKYSARAHAADWAPCMGIARPPPLTTLPG